MFTKSDAAWLLVRAIGIAFVFTTIWQAVVTGYFAYAICQPATDSGHVRYFLIDEIKIRGSVSVVCAVLAMYFLRRGKLVHSWFVRE